MLDLESLFGYEAPPVAIVSEEQVFVEIIADPTAESVAEDYPTDDDPWPEDNESRPTPCPACGSLELWENLLGGWRCMKCDPPAKGIKLLEKIERIRKKVA